MVALYNHCTFNLNPRATSIDTTLHGFVPHAHVDHVHADAVIAIAASENAEALTREIYGGELGFLPWQRPGFDLGLKLGAMAEANPNMKGVVLGGHGLFTWGPTSKECYRITLEMINKAAQWLGAKAQGAAFGGPRVEALAAGGPARCCGEAPARHSQAYFRKRAQDRPLHRRAGGAGVRQFSRSQAAGRAWDVLPGSFPAHQDPPARAALRPDGAQSRRGDRVARQELSPTTAPTTPPIMSAASMPNSPAMRDPNAVIYLVPGVGMLSFAKDKSTARIASEFYVNAINVMRGATERRPLCRAFGAGSVQYRILAAGRGQASAHAEAEIARRARRAGDRRRGRHRAGDRGSAHGRRRLRRARRHRRPKPRCGRRRLRQAVRQGRGQRASMST